MRSQKNIFIKCLSYVIVLLVLFSIPLGILSSAEEGISGIVDFEKYKLGYPQTSENGILINTDSSNSNSGKFSLRYGYHSDISNAKNGAFALLSFGGDSIIPLKTSTMYRIKFKYMLKGSTNCSVDLAFFSSSSLTPNSSKYRDEIGRSEKIVTAKTKKNVWIQRSVDIACDDSFISFNGKDCNALAIGFYSYIDSGMGNDTYIYIDDIEVVEVGPAHVYTIKFNSNGGSTVNDISGILNREIILPTAPVKDNEVFAGWYTDSSLSQKFHDSIFSANITLYAKWLPAGSSFIDFNSDEYSSIYKVSSGVQTGISEESSYSPAQSLKYWNIGNYGARRILKTEDNNSVKVKNHTLYRINFSYRNYSQTPAYFEAMTSGQSLYTGTQVFGGVFVLSKEDEWKNATYYLYTDLFAEEENYLAFYIKGEDNNKSDIFVDDIEITEASVPQGHSIVLNIDYNDGENAVYMTGNENDPLKITEPVRDGYKFIGWCEDNWYVNDFYDDAFYYTKKIYAKWAKLKQIQNFDDTYNHTGRSLGYDLDIEIYDSTKDSISANKAISKPNSIHRIGSSELKKGFVLYDNMMEPLISGQNYMISFAVLVEKATDPEKEIEIAQTRAANYAWACDDENYPMLAVEDLPVGKWVKVSYIMTVFEKYLSIFTSGKNSIYFDDFTIEWVPEDAEFENGEYVLISELSADDLLSGGVPGGSLPQTGEKNYVIPVCIIATAAVLSFVLCTVYINKKRRQK